MRLSSRLALCVCAAALTFANAAEAARSSGFAGVATGVRPNVIRVRPNVIRGLHPGGMPLVRTGVNPNVRPGIFDRRIRRGGFRGRGFGYGGGDLDAAGLGLGLANDFPAPPEDGSYGGGPDASPPDLQPPPFALPPPPPACPLIIEVGHGLAQRVKSRVVYGTPYCRN